jgi:hypothetical protein
MAIASPFSTLPPALLAEPDDNRNLAIIPAPRSLSYAPPHPF